MKTRRRLLAGVLAFLFFAGTVLTGVSFESKADEIVEEGGGIHYCNEGILGFNIGDGDKGDVFFKVKNGTEYRVGGDETNSEETIQSALGSVTFASGDKILVKASAHEGKIVTNFDIQIDGVTIFSSDDQRTTARTAAESSAGYELTVPTGYASKPIEFSIDFADNATNDIDYTEAATVSGNLTKDNILIKSNVAVTVGSNVVFRVDKSLTLESGATLKGTNQNSILDIAQNASVNGLVLYDTDGTTTVDTNSRFTNHEEFEWDNTANKWKKRSNGGTPSEPGGSGTSIEVSISCAAGMTPPNHYGVEVDETNASGTSTGSHSNINESNTSDTITVNSDYIKIKVSSAGKDIYYNGSKDNSWADGKIIAKSDLAASYAFQLQEPENSGGATPQEPGGDPTPVEVDSNGYPVITDGANIFVNVAQGGIIGELKFNTRGVSFTNDGLKGATRVNEFAGDTVSVSLQIEFGKAISKVTINGTEYSGTTLASAYAGSDLYNFSVPKTEDGHYSFSFVEAESTVSTIIWTYDANDPSGPNGDTYSNDALVQHGKVEIVSIKRGGTVLYANGNYASGVDPNRDKVSVDIAGQRGYVRLEKGDDIVIKLIPDYGYQLTTARINDRDLTPVSNNFSDVSTFKLDNVQGQMHFSGVFTAKSDVINTPADKVSSATIANGNNAASSGNLKLDVANGAADANALAKAKGTDDEGEYTTVATLDLTLTNVVSQGTEGNNWTNQITEFSRDITVGLNLSGITVADGEKLIVVRKHGDEYDVITGATLQEGVLSVPTNKFSTYSIIKTSSEVIVESDVSLAPESAVEKAEITTNTVDLLESDPSIAVEGQIVDVTVGIEEVQGAKLVEAKNEFASVNTAMAPGLSLNTTILDITISKSLNGGATTLVSELGNPIELSFKMSDLTSIINLLLIRSHNGSVTYFGLLASRPTPGNYVDGTMYIDGANGIVYVYSKYYSYYEMIVADGDAYRVDFETNGGSNVNPMLVAAGKTGASLPTPTRAGYTFAGWYKDSALTTALGSAEAINQSLYLYAKWTAVPVAQDDTSGDVTQTAAESPARSITPANTGDSFRPGLAVALMITSAAVMAFILLSRKKSEQ